jgi:hypothetical protein
VAPMRAAAAVQLGRDGGQQGPCNVECTK